LQAKVKQCDHQQTNLNDYLKNYSPYMLHTGINILFS